MNPDVDRPFVVRLARAFLYAWRGVAMVSRDRMFRCQLIAAILVTALAAWLGMTMIEWAMLTLTIAFVLAMEAINSAIETCVNLAMPTQHPLAARAKDVAAGAVLIASVGAVVVGVMLLGPKVCEQLV